MRLFDVTIRENVHVFFVTIRDFFCSLRTTFRRRYYCCSLQARVSGCALHTAKRNRPLWRSGQDLFGIQSQPFTHWGPETATNIFKFSRAVSRHDWIHQLVSSQTNSQFRENAYSPTCIRRDVVPIPCLMS